MKRPKAVIDKMHVLWERDRRIIADRDSGLTLSALSQKYGINKSRIQQIVKFNRKKLPPIEEYGIKE